MDGSAFVWSPNKPGPQTRDWLIESTQSLRGEKFVELQEVLHGHEDYLWINREHVSQIDVSVTIEILGTPRWSRSAQPPEKMFSTRAPTTAN